MTESVSPANSMGSSSSVSGTGGIDTYDKLMTVRPNKPRGKSKKSLKDIVKTRSLKQIQGVS